MAVRKTYRCGRALGICASRGFLGLTRGHSICNDGKGGSQSRYLKIKNKLWQFEAPLSKREDDWGSTISHEETVTNLLIGSDESDRPALEALVPDCERMQQKQAWLERGRQLGGGLEAHDGEIDVISFCSQGGSRGGANSTDRGEGAFGNLDARLATVHSIFSFCCWYCLVYCCDSV